MEIEEHHPHEQDLRMSYPRGGPIYVPFFVGPMTSIPEFQVSVAEELRSLEAELGLVSKEAFEDELSVDELKVFTDEELVERALKEAFKDDEQEQAKSSEISKEQTNNERSTCHPRSLGNEGSSFESSGTACSTSEPCNSSTVVEACDEVNYEITSHDGSKKRKKRGRTFDRNTRATELEGSYLTKVRELATIKKKQDEDKAAVTLHSFRGTNAIIEAPVSGPEKTEKLRTLRFITSGMKAKSFITQDNIPIHDSEIVLSIEVYHSRKSYLKTQEFMVLGRQTLIELKDNIACVTDQLMYKAGQSDPSGYFLIEDVFYNDLRDPSAIDYSQPIFNWLKNFNEEAQEKWESVITSMELLKKQKSMFGSGKTSQLPNFKAVHMHKARFLDLRFRLGCGYLYCHQGDCKHIIVVRDLRLIHPDDVQNRTAYPICTFQLRPRRQKCSICKIYFATKVTVDDKWAQDNPSYFCEMCYFLLHYDGNGSLLYDEFSVYDYHQD